MARISDEKLYEWLSPITEYKWHDDTDPGDIPYRYGLVILDGNNVVGYCGATYSLQNIGGKKRLYVCFSTFAVDEAYRFYIFPATKELCKTAEVLTDFTPRESMRRLFVESFHFQQVNDKQIIMPPVPSFSGKVNVKFIDRVEDINDPEQRQIFADHKPYGVKCCLFSRNGEEGCIFYMSGWRMRWKRRIPCWKRVVVLKVFNSDLLSQNLHEIVWKIQKHEGFYVMCNIDAAFINADTPLPLHITRTVHRLIFSREEIPDDYNYDFMYSEMSMLKM